MLVELLDYLDAWLLLRTLVVVDWYQDHYPPERLPCTGTIMCECQRRNCPGRTVGIRTYVNGIRKADPWHSNHPNGTMVTTISSTWIIR